MNYRVRWYWDNCQRFLCASRCYSCTSLMTAPCAGVKRAVRNSCFTAALPIVSPSLCLLFRFLAKNSNSRLFLDAISCSSRLSSRICRDGQLCVWICGRHGRWTSYTSAQHSAEGSAPATAMRKVTRGNTGNRGFPVTRTKPVVCSKTLRFRAQLQHCAGNGGTELQHTW